MGDKKPTQGLCFTCAYNGITRSLITLTGIESAINKQDKIEINALWDTGASLSLIKRDIAIRLNLQPVSKTFICTASDDNVPSNIYLVNLFLPNHTIINRVQVAEGVLKGCDMLIGMDVITLGDFVISNYDNKTTFTFRMPSLTKFDFCKDSYLLPSRNEAPKISRNDPCPCGSGRKYKHCCINKQTPFPSIQS